MTTERGDDFSRAPWLYPGTPVDRSDPIDPVELEQIGSAGRTLVVAVGSNASRAVMQRKFERYGVSPVVSFLRARVTGLRVGHSAHVSAPGYIPAAPVADPTVRTDLVASLMDADGLAALDATEPNYVRTELPADRFPIELSPAGPDGRTVAHPASFWVYLSRHGVLGPARRRALQLLAQERLFTLLAEECIGFGRLADGGPRAVMRALAASADLRRTGRQVLRDAGWARSAGLGPG
ncbi:hypothetical protein [Microlunatus soli]|uniref:Uncharacterized protein n=1 Tax=Microlunatus soli TaxID=630515 RepID=A0A1H1WEV3_9ACTN|nr:hypothetical protein [Microlunatus soli]SDS95918.1 hypothetical protein SAMN04489812_3633 [Microlunatus soli]